ncbi:GAF domain-containing protein [Roseibium sp. Sym1]|uniref:GAF domain-containing protein n=1 Tax=Roseibium sp. Sym1 TaxID=3016006 RepID=UPI0022B2AE5F|nr:GAF domain-containing protein [Roseibium sp. Sym1]
MAVSIGGVAGNHADFVYSVTGSARAAQSPIAASWWRSLHYHGLRPETSVRPDALSGAELNCARGQIDDILAIARPVIGRLFSVVGDPGCCVALSDADGVVCEMRCKTGDRKEFDNIGLSPGSVWREETEGTNGIGTCLAEKQPIMIHRNQHFYKRNTDLSCIDAPIFDSRGRLAGALDVSSCRSDLTIAFARVIAVAVSDAARQIEAELFHAAYPDARIVVGEAGYKGGPVLFAINEDDLIVGATRAARRLYKLPAAWHGTPCPASDVLTGRRHRSDFKSAIRGEVQRALARSKGNVAEAARDLGISRATMYRRMKTLAAQ